MDSASKAQPASPAKPTTGATITRPPGRVEGWVDTSSWERISGWCWHSRHPGVARLVDFVVDGVVILSVLADLDRPDLVEAGKGDGRHGFRAGLPRALFSAPIVFVNVRDRESGLDIDNSPIRLVNDEAGLDEATQNFLADRVARLAGCTDQGLLETQTAFLLRQVDTILNMRQVLERTRAEQLAQWSQLLERAGGGSFVTRLLDVARHQYGETLELPTSTTPEVSVIVPVHNQFWYTYQCMKRIAESGPKRSFEVILVDDGSTDETILAGLLLVGVRIVRNSGNLGFVGSINAGAAIARGHKLLLLNNDTEVLTGWLDELADTLDADPGIGIAGSRLLFPDGRLQEVGGIIFRLGDGWNYGRDQDPERPEYRHLRDADYVSGAALMIRRDVWDAVGALSPEYAPGYYEDTDLCFKVRAAGWRTVVQPLSRVIHHEGVTSGTDVSGTGMKRHQRTNMVRFAARWADTLRGHGLNGTIDPAQEAERLVLRRALFIDDSVPTPDRDAGSTVALEHMRSLQRLGYQVHFVPADNMARIAPYTEALERIGIRCHVAPYERSAEEVLRNAEGRFDLIYLHRVANARFISVARSRNPTARMIFNVADLHHLRMQREAEFARDPTLIRRAERMRADELAAIGGADVTIVHSTVEAELLATSAPGARVAVMPWVVRPSPVKAAFADRTGVAFVGSRHPPNIDAAEWLLSEIMPRVWAKVPGIELHLVGELAIDPRVRAAGGECAQPARVRLVGWVEDLSATLADRRLTVAPLRYGAGLKGKLLDSLAMGLPCVMTPCAAEGAGLPPSLLELMGETAETLAALIVAYHQDAARSAVAAEAGLAYIAATCSEARIDSLMRAIALDETPAAEPAPETGGSIIRMKSRRS